MFACILFLSACRTGPAVEPVAVDGEPDLVITEEGVQAEKNAVDDTKENDENTVDDEEGTTDEDNKDTESDQENDIATWTPEGKLLQIKDDEIERLTERAKELKKENDALRATLEAVEKEPLSQSDIEKRTQGKDTPFKQCGALGLFENAVWYENFLDQIDVRRFQRFGSNDVSYVNLEAVTAACYSEAAEILTFIVEGEENGYGYAMMRYDTKNDSLQIAQLNAHDQEEIAPPLQFGKRNGQSIELSGNLPEGTCVYDMTYEYDFIANVMRLKQNCKRCGGENTCQDYQ